MLVDKATRKLFREACMKMQFGDRILHANPSILYTKIIRNQTIDPCALSLTDTLVIEFYQWTRFLKDEDYSKQDVSESYLKLT